MFTEALIAGSCFSTSANAHRHRFKLEKRKVLMPKLKEGQEAPDFEVLDTNGNKVKLSDFKGKKVILYFYPKDDTPGCTKEACSLRDGFSELKKAGMVMLGVSKDSIESHQKFTKKFNLPFQLLADTDKKIVKAYGVYGDKSFMGRIFKGIKRTTFLIDEKGKIAKILDNVNCPTHAQDILEMWK